MNTKTINIKKDKALEVLKSLESIEFIDNNKIVYLKNLKPKNESKEDSLVDLQGIWKDREISIKQIREKAWPQRK